MMVSMAGRIVVGFLTRVEAHAPDDAHAYVKRVNDLCKKAEALGGRLCAFGSRSVAFDFGLDELKEAIGLARGANQDAAGEPQDHPAVSPWRVGIAEGKMDPLAVTGTLARLGWGPPLVTAIALARIARPGELLIDPEVRGVVAGDVSTSGLRVSKDARGVRGLVVDARQPLAREPEERIIPGLVQPAFVGLHSALGELLSTHAPLGLIRGDPGYGGTRLLTEIETALSPARSLYLCTAGAEPLGALRRAFARSIALSGPVPPQSLSRTLGSGLDRLLSGDGVDVRLGAELVVRWVTLLDPKHDGSPANGAVLVDHATDVDDPSLDVVASAAKLAPGTFRLVVRIDASFAPPSPLQPLETGPVINLGPLPKACAEELAASAARGRISSNEAKRWARRGGYLPLGIVEALAEGLEGGGLAGPDVELASKEWILRRLRFVRPKAKDILTAIAVLGVEVAAPLVHELLTIIGGVMGVGEIAGLSDTGWLRTEPPGFYTLSSRTHREVLLSQIADDERSRWHEAASLVVQRLGGKLAMAEAARHAALSGDHQRAVELALVAARATRPLNLEAATEALLAFAGASPEDIALLPAPTTDFRLLSWIDALRVSGDRNGAAARLTAIASLAKGETTEALAALREGMELTEHASPVARSRASLAYGIALAVAGRQSEALLIVLQALARAREGKELHGERACARFLTRLAVASGHQDAAGDWQAVAGDSG